MVLYYLLCPVYYAVLKRCANDLKKTLLAIMLIFLVTVAFWNSLHLNVITTRLPVLFLGMLVAKMCIDGGELTVRMKATVIGAIPVGIALLILFANFFTEQYRAWGLVWYPFILIVPGTCFVISMVSMLLERNAISKHIVSAVSWIGQSSFEIFLTHILLFEVLRYCIENRILSDNWFIWIITLILSMILAGVLKRMTAQAKKCLNW